MKKDNQESKIEKNVSTNCKEDFNNKKNNKKDLYMNLLKNTHINKFIIVFFFILAFFQLILYFNNKYYALPSNVSNILKLIIFTALAFFISSLVIKFTSKIFINFFGNELEIESILFLQKFYSFFIYLIATSIVLLKLGLSLNNLSVFLGLATTGFAFAIREVILSYIIWFILLIKKPFRIGDFIKIGDEEGKVMHIGTFYVLLDNTLDNKDDFIRIPNKVFLEKPIINFGKDKVLSNLEVYLKKIPINYKNIANNLEKEFSGYLLKVNLNSSKEGISILITFRSDYLEKNKIITTILEEIKNFDLELN